MDGPVDIPKFDLAEEIMAEQRKVAATRRKGPGRKAIAAEPRAPEPAAPVLPLCQAMQACEAEGVIVEIVARDIRQLCGGYAVGVRP